jgi:hypothetical protein
LPAESAARPTRRAAVLLKPAIGQTRKNQANKQSKGHFHNRENNSFKTANLESQKSNFAF